MTLCEWNGHKFEVNPEVIRTFKDLSITSEIETSDKAKDKQGYVERKKTKALSVTMTAMLYTLTGCDPQSESQQFLNDSAEGVSDYLYIGEEKLFSCKMMLTKVTVQGIEINSAGQWSECEVQLTFTQATLFDGKSTGGDKTGGGTTKKKTGFFGPKNPNTTAQDVQKTAGEIAKEFLKTGSFATIPTERKVIQKSSADVENAKKNGQPAPLTFKKTAMPVYQTYTKKD